MKFKFIFLVLSLFVVASTEAAHATEYKRVEVRRLKLTPLTAEDFIAPRKAEPTNHKLKEVKRLKLKPLTAEQLGF
jgi:hypothetical protein